MLNLNLVLVKTVEYELKPFGKFKFKWSPSEALKKRTHVLPIREVSWTQNTGMPYSELQSKEIVKYMKKHKTDILIDSHGRLLTIMSDRFTEISHPKLRRYLEFLSQRERSDSEEMWEEYKN